MCEDCTYVENGLDNDYKSNPCNTCIIWEDGYLTFRNYEPKKYQEETKEV